MSTAALDSEWAYLRGGFLAVAALLASALVGWGIYAAVHEDLTAFELMTRCLVNEKGVPLETPRDPIARSADLGTLRTTIETNGVTASVSSTPEKAERIVSSYRSVAGELAGRLEQRGGTVFLWDRPASPTQRQAMFDCTY